MHHNSWRNVMSNDLHCHRNGLKRKACRNVKVNHRPTFNQYCPSQDQSLGVITKSTSVNEREKVQPVVVMCFGKMVTLEPLETVWHGEQNTVICLNMETRRYICAATGMMRRRCGLSERMHTIDWLLLPFFSTRTFSKSLSEDGERRRLRKL